MWKIFNRPNTYKMDKSAKEKEEQVTQMEFDILLTISKCYPLNPMEVKSI